MARASLRLLLPPLATLAFAGAAPAEDTSPRGAQLLAPFKESLRAALVDGLAAGPVAAIDACRLRAPALATAYSRDGVALGRTSHRLRNPANTGPEWVTPVLAEWLDNPGERPPRTMTLEDGREGYVEPILLQPMCVTCHGNVLTPDLEQAIRAVYPGDEATGFEVGELRGVFWVEYPAE